MVFRSRAHGRGLHIDASAAAVPASDLLSRRLLKPSEWRLRRPSSGRSPSFLEVDVQRASSRRRSWKKKLLTFLQGSSQSWMSSQSNDVVAASVFTGHSRRVRAVIINLHRSASVLRDPRLSDSVRVCNEIRGSDVGGVPRDVFRQGEALFSLASILERGLRSIHAAPTARGGSVTLDPREQRAQRTRAVQSLKPATGMPQDACEPSIFAC